MKDDNKNKEVIANKTDQSMDAVDMAELKLAKYDMENIGTIMQGLNSVGSKVESGLKMLPEKQKVWLSSNISKILFKLLKSNIATLQKNKEFKKPSNLTYKALVGVTGAGSGFFGSLNPVGTAVFVSELALSTKFMLRSIMDIARSEGEDIYTPEAQMACLQVFALGGESEDDDAGETSYYSSRMAMSTALKGATAYISKHGFKGLGKMMMTSANPVMMAIGLIASRLTVQVSEKFLSQAVPLIGAAGGAGINYVFMDHFQSMAKSHFVIRRLERKYGELVVKSYYNQIIID